MSTYRGEPPTDGRTRRTMSPEDRSAWQRYKSEYARAKAFDEALRALAWVVLVLVVSISLAVGCSRSARAAAWGTLPEDALQLCFINDGSFDCLNRVSDFDTLRFCPGTGDALDDDAPPGLLLVGFTDGLTGEFTVVRAQPYQWRQYQAYDRWILVGIDELQGSFADGFESCDEYRT